MRIIVIGAVGSTKRILDGLIRNKSNVVGVMGLRQSNSKKVAGYVDLEPIASEFSIDFKSFSKINDPENIEWISSRKPDVIFAVGFSQIVGSKILKIPTYSCVGFHPTNLPKGRGRAPLAWMILNEEDYGAACFFVMGEKADDGDLLKKTKFKIDDRDYAKDLENKIYNAIDTALDEWIPQLNKGVWSATPQKHEEATFYGKRTEQDAWIDWNKDSISIERVVRACGDPYFGAITCFGHRRIVIKRAKSLKRSYFGVIGRVVDFEDGQPIIQTGNGHVLLEEFYEVDESNNENILITLPIGSRLGINQNDLFKIIKKSI